MGKKISELNEIENPSGEAFIPIVEDGRNYRVKIDNLPCASLPEGVKNDVLINNGTEWVAAPEGTTFTFSIASFTASGFSIGTQLIGVGNVNEIGSITFSATYNNGPATSGYISKSGWSNLNLGGVGYVGPTINDEVLPYPSPGASISLTLHASDDVDSSTNTKTATYQNVIRIAALDHGISFTQSDFDGAEVSVTTGDNTQTWASVSLAAEYWVFMVPARVGLPSYFYDNSTGFAIDMNVAGAETVSIENSLGFVEDYLFVSTTYPLTYNMVGRTA